MAAPAARARSVDVLLGRGLPALLHRGFGRTGGESAGMQLKVQLTEPRFRDLLRASDLLRVPPAAIVREIVRVADFESDRHALELEYRRHKGPGDPSCLGTTVLRGWLASKNDPNPLLNVVTTLIEEVSDLKKRIDRIASKIENYQPQPAPVDLLKMGEQELRAYLRRLGGRAPRTAARSELLTLIRKKQEDLRP